MWLDCVFNRKGESQRGLDGYPDGQEDKESWGGKLPAKDQNIRADGWNILAQQGDLHPQRGLRRVITLFHSKPVMPKVELG